MPYRIEQKDDKFCVYNSDTGDKMGEHDSRQDAMKQMRALYAQEGKGGSAKQKPEKKSSKKSKKQVDHEEDHDY